MSQHNTDQGSAGQFSAGKGMPRQPGQGNFGQQPTQRQGMFGQQQGTMSSATHQMQRQWHAGPFEDWRDKFHSLDWSKGFTTDDLRQHFAEIPPNAWQSFSFPTGQKFYGFEEFWQHTRTPSDQEITTPTKASPGPGGKGR